MTWKRGYQVAEKNSQLNRSRLSTDEYGDPDNCSDVYGYNGRGAMVCMPLLYASANPKFTRDSRERIRSAQTDSAAPVSHYAYNASGQRVRRVVVNTSVVEQRITLGSCEVWRKKSSGGACCLR